MTPVEVALETVHKRLLDALRLLDGVCREHGLTYWLDGGSLLGAVRHGGFIPWDDDADVCLLRSDFDILRSIPPEAFGPDFGFLARPSGHFAVNAKIVVPELRGVPHGQPNRSTAATVPISLDIVAVDPAIGREPVRRGLTRVGRALASHYAAHDRSEAAHSARGRWGWRMLQGAPVRWVDGGLGCLVWASSKASAERLQYGIDTAVQDTVFPADVVLPVAPIVFDGHVLSGPHDPDGYLRTYYGQDYLTPPVVQSSPHAAAFWRTR